MVRNKVLHDIFRSGLACRTIASALLLWSASAALPTAFAADPVHATESGGDGADLYADPDKWLCRPGREDLCAGNEASTAVAADGSLMPEMWQPAVDPGIDCFYVYPTISNDPHGNSSLVPGTGERRAVQFQFARFASVCRPYAPMYRQVTLAGLASQMLGKPIPIDPELAYGDVLAAWRHYLKFDNHGRGVVLIGHSQGSRMLLRLVKEEIDGKPAEAHLVSALLLGFNVPVPKGQAVGGVLSHVPLCRSATETGCVITYVSFRASSPPPPGSRFAQVPEADMEAGCTDPGKLSGAPIRTILPTHINLLGDSDTEHAWDKMADIIDTPFVTLTGLIETRCVSDAHGSYLAVSIHSAPGDLRPHDIPGDLYYQGHLVATWGLHLVDVNLAMGNLIDIVRRQAQAYQGRHPQKKERSRVGAGAPSGQ